ncbi:MAG: hypothetical protein ACLVB1_10380 [Blautia obeum]
MPDQGISADGNSFRSNRGYAAEFIRSHISSYKGNRFEENGYSNRIHVRNSKIRRNSVTVRSVHSNGIATIAII